ncbi:MAG: glycosyltransferase family 2 protein [Myxococcota bacterium]
MSSPASESQMAAPGSRDRVPRPSLSVVVPAYNEEDSLDPLFEEVKGVMDGIGEPWELIFVDDGSSDGTVRAMYGIADRDPRVKVVKFVRNFGKSAAYMAGFSEIEGQTVITLDADLQDDPNEIPRMLERLRTDGWDLIVGWKQGRAGNEPHKALPSKVFNGLIALLFGLRLHDSNCGFRVMRSEVAQSLDLYGDQYRFIPEFAHVKGFRVTEEGVNHRKRKFGRSKYGPKRFWTGLLDLLTVRFITAFADRPLHFFGTLGLGPFALGVMIEMYVLVAKLLGSTFQVHVAAIIIGVMLIVVGFQCIITGLIGEMLSAQQRARRFVVDARQIDVE